MHLREFNQLPTLSCCSLWIHSSASTSFPKHWDWIGLDCRFRDSTACTLPLTLPNVLFLYPFNSSSTTRWIWCSSSSAGWIWWRRLWSSSWVERKRERIDPSSTSKSPRWSLLVTEEGLVLAFPEDPEGQSLKRMVSQRKFTFLALTASRDLTRRLLGTSIPPSLFLLYQLLQLKVVDTHLREEDTLLKVVDHKHTHKYVLELIKANRVSLPLSSLPRLMIELYSLLISFSFLLHSSSSC